MKFQLACVQAAEPGLGGSVPWQRGLHAEQEYPSTVGLAVFWAVLLLMAL